MFADINSVYNEIPVPFNAHDTPDVYFFHNASKSFTTF